MRFRLYYNCVFASRRGLVRLSELYYILRYALIPWGWGPWQVGDGAQPKTQPPRFGCKSFQELILWTRSVLEVRLAFPRQAFGETCLGRVMNVRF